MDLSGILHDTRLQRAQGRSHTRAAGRGADVRSDENAGDEAVVPGPDW